MTKIFAKIVESREMTLKLGKIKHEPRNNNWVKNFLVAYFFFHTMKISQLFHSYVFHQMNVFLSLTTYINMNLELLD